jgi:hypothetical protein
MLIVSRTHSLFRYFAISRNILFHLVKIRDAKQIKCSRNGHPFRMFCDTETQLSCQKPLFVEWSQPQLLYFLLLFREKFRITLNVSWYVLAKFFAKTAHFAWFDVSRNSIEPFHQTPNLNRNTAGGTDPIACSARLAVPANLVVPYRHDWFSSTGTWAKRATWRMTGAKLVGPYSWTL